MREGRPWVWSCLLAFSFFPPPTPPPHKDPGYLSGDDSIRLLQKGFPTLALVFRTPRRPGALLTAQFCASEVTQRAAVKSWCELLRGQLTEIQAKLPACQRKILVLLPRWLLWCRKIKLSSILWIKWALAGQPGNLPFSEKMNSKLCLRIVNHLTASYSSSHPPGKPGVWPAGVNEDHFIFLITNLLGKKNNLHTHPNIFQAESSNFRCYPSFFSETNLLLWLPPRSRWNLHTTSWRRSSEYPLASLVHGGEDSIRALVGWLG